MFRIKKIIFPKLEGYISVRLSRRSVFYFLLILTFVSFTTAISSGLWLKMIGGYFIVDETKGPADAVVVLGGGGSERLMHGIDLYREGLAAEVWITGDGPLETMRHYTNGRIGRDLAVAQGIPYERIRLLQTNSTWEDGEQIRRELSESGADSIIVVTSWYHTKRASRVVRRHTNDLPVVIYFSYPEIKDYGPHNWWKNKNSAVWILNEFIKSIYYFVNYGII